ncbi:MAG: hypothetical protein VKP72_04035, partial [bacterium]|nr:hypothetical protein [bacterium]
MSLDLAGLGNEQAFFPAHYLETGLETELSELASLWREAATGGAEPPDERLARDGRLWAERLHAAARVGRWFEPDGTSDDGAVIEAPEALRELWGPWLEALGHDVKALEALGEGPAGEPLVAWTTVNRPGGEPWLVAIDAAWTGEDDPLDALEDAVSRQVFGAAEPPRWVLLLHPRQVVLLDRLKWHDGRALRFDMAAFLVENRTPARLRLMAGMLARESLCPSDAAATAWMEALEQRAQKHAHGVSEDLKYAMREVIELLGNEMLRYHREVSKQGVYGGEIDAGALTVECLRVAYRLLFLLYLEARPELGYAPTRDAAYRTAYGLEGLAALVDVPLVSEQARDGYYFHHGVAWLFGAIHDGVREPAALGFQTGGERVFELPALRCHLFDPARTPFFNKVKLRNHVWQRILRLMTLTREAAYLPAARRKIRKGRISYRTLGIEQLGSVYESLLSFRGFFATEDLYEVRPDPAAKKRRDDDPAADGDDATRGDDAEETDMPDEEPGTDETAPEPASGGRGRATEHDPLEQAYFVPLAELPAYGPEERVYDETGEVRRYPRGTFIYRLAGRDRERSASFYTPQVLTRCLVKYALEVRLEGKSAADILDLTVLEPAMGSAAFLNETISQLAEAYLTRRERELDEAGLLATAAPEGQSPDVTGRLPDGRTLKLEGADRQAAIQRVRMHLADQRVFGIDLNPVAVELAEVSLWLHTLCPADAGGTVHVPWFGQQLVTGNSLVGARRQVFPAASLGKGASASWKDLAPEGVPVGAERPAGTVYHFLVPDDAMGEVRDKVLAARFPEQVATLKAWRKAFLQPWSPSDVTRLERLSDAVDRLWDEAVTSQRKLREATTDRIALWGQEAPPGQRVLTTAEKDALYEAAVLTEHQRFASAYGRLKLVMDAWCALWAWPLDRVDLLPTRDEWLMELALVLEGNPVAVSGDQLGLFEGESPPAEQLGLDLSARLGRVQVQELVETLPRWQVVRQVAARLRPLHVELEFADVFADRGGFDLVVGNPPWLKLEWSEKGVMGDFEPRFVLRNHRAADLARLRDEAFVRKPELAQAYVTECRDTLATVAYLGARQNYPLLMGTKTNLYKCFLTTAWRMAHPEHGVTALVHQEGVYDDPKGGALRAALYPRLRYHFRLVNLMQLFHAVGCTRPFSLNVSSNRVTSEHWHISNLLQPGTIEESFAHVGTGPVGGIKADDGRWNLRGHRDRLVRVDASRLALFSELLDGGEVPPGQARFPTVHATSLLAVLQKFAAVPRRLGDLGDDVVITMHWNETTAQTDGTIRRETRFVAGPEELVLSGPHFFVGNPLSKTPRARCVTKSDYDVLDLEALPDTYWPRTNYVPACDAADYRRRLPRWPGTDRVVTDGYWVVVRSMLAQNGERTLIPALMPPGLASVNTCQAIHARSEHRLLDLLALMSSLPCDYRIRSTGAGGAYKAVLERLPLLEPT